MLRMGRKLSMTMMRTMKCVSEQLSPIHHPRSWSREGLGLDVQFAQSEVPSHLLPVMSQPVSHVPPVMLQVALAKSYNKKYEKRIALTKMPKTVFKKIIVVTAGAVPIPILMAPDLSTTLQGNLSLNWEMNQLRKTLNLPQLRLTGCLLKMMSLWMKC